MSRRTRALILGATLVAMNLAAMTAVAHAQATDGPTGEQAARRPPTQGRVGEAWHQPQVAPDSADVAGEVRRPPTESQVGEPWRHQSGVPGATGRTGRAVRLAHRFAQVLGCGPRLGGRASGARRHAARPQYPGQAVDLITIAVTPHDGAAAPTRQPHHLADGLVPYLAYGHGIASVR